jgi:putative ribosome biogenesis GTPase RsgA
MRVKNLKRKRFNQNLNNISINSSNQIDKEIEALLQKAMSSFVRDFENQQFKQMQDFISKTVLQFFGNSGVGGTRQLSERQLIESLFNDFFRRLF